MDSIFVQLAIILAVAFVVSYIVRAFKQPIIIGYIIAGMIISPFIIKFGASTEIINVFSKFGIAFLLFIVGLHLNPKVIREIGVSSLLIGLFQIIVTFIVGFLISFWVIGYGSLTSFYIGIGLAFSSTIVVMKLLSDRRQLDSLFGKISIGILIIQDLVAIGILLFISPVLGDTGTETFAVKGLLEGAGIIIILFLAGFFILPRLTKSVAKSQELLFLFSICWCFIISALFFYLGFSIEIGALIAGVVLSISPFSTEISSKIRPLRDFFLIIFFIILGLDIHISNFSSIITNAIILSLVVLILKPLILIFFMAMFRYTKRTNFLVGTTLAQISEFSLVILALGVTAGRISSDILATLTLTGIITIALSSYMVIYSEKFYSIVSNFFFIFERKRPKKEEKKKKEYDIVLFGYNRIGFSVLQSLRALKKRYLVVDFNPDVIAKLNKFKIPCMYGDAYDLEFLGELELDKSKLIVSTVPDAETNLLLIEYVKGINPKIIVIVRASSISNALNFYKKGADYVLTPHFLGGEYIAKMIKEEGIKGDYTKEKQNHIKMLLDRIEQGHNHPDIEKN
jgi:Kef-type K+ transport system membrane component KefB/Trk K+ transport system NAD-binding subunit